MRTLNNPAFLHRERAECFSTHASNTKNPDTRQMYLRLANMEVALAERAERQTPQHVETGKAVSTALEGSAGRHRS